MWEGVRKLEQTVVNNNYTNNSSDNNQTPTEILLFPGAAPSITSKHIEKNALFIG